MKEKSEANTIFKFFHNIIQNQFQTKIKRSDIARKYFNSILREYFRIHQQNGIIERKKKKEICLK